VIAWLSSIVHRWRMNTTRMEWKLRHLEHKARSAEQKVDAVYMMVARLQGNMNGDREGREENGQRH
jgi:hypothetical protein